MKILIIGGTGTLGNCLVEKLYGKHDLTVFSRDELKQQTMKKKYPDCRYIIGDVRHMSSLSMAMHGQDACFHVAALKHVDVLEDNPEESVYTNILGTINISNLAIKSGVKHVVFSSTDKAVHPINTYGMSKGISEKILLRKNETQKNTHFAIYRWGNVIGSRGSAIYSFVDSLMKEGSAYLTDESMTRFWIRIEDAVDFMLSTFMNSSGVMIPPMKSASVKNVVDVISEILQISEYRTFVTGMRRGEKITEEIDFGKDSATSEQYTKEELKKLIEPVVQEILCLHS